MPKERDEVIEKFMVILGTYAQGFSIDAETLIEQILAIPRLVILADDQSLPQNTEPTKLMYATKEETQQEMVNEGWVKEVKSE